MGGALIHGSQFTPPTSPYQGQALLPDPKATEDPPLGVPPPLPRGEVRWGVHLHSTIAAKFSPQPHTDDNRLPDLKHV